MASCTEKTAAWILEIPVVQDARRTLSGLGKKYKKLCGELLSYSFSPSSSLMQFEK